MSTVNCNSVGSFSPGTDNLELEAARTYNILGVNLGLPMEQPMTEDSEASDCNEAPILVGYCGRRGIQPVVLIRAATFGTGCGLSSRGTTVCTT